MDHDFRKHFGRFFIIGAVVYPLWYLAMGGDGIGLPGAFILGSVLMLGVIWSDRL